MSIDLSVSLEKHCAVLDRLDSIASSRFSWSNRLNLVLSLGGFLRLITSPSPYLIGIDGDAPAAQRRLIDEPTEVQPVPV